MGAEARSNHAVLQIEDLSYTYPDGTCALRGVSLSLRPGERMALLGPNGAGKSTLLLVLSGILPSRGALRWRGKPLMEEDLPALRRQVGLVFQDPDDQLFMPTVWEDVAFGPANLGLERGEVERRVAEALERMGLSGCAERPPHHLSLGERKRAALAAVLAMRPEILLLDEPTANLDPRGRKQLLAFLAGLPQTLVVATHDLEAARALCHRGILLDGGQVVADEALESLLKDTARLERHGLA